eukprot:2407_1
MALIKRQIPFCFMLLLVTVLIMNCYLILQYSHVWTSNEDHLLDIDAFVKDMEYLQDGEDATTKQDDKGFSRRNVLVLMVDNRFHMEEFSTEYYFFTLMINILYAERYNYSFVALEITSNSRCGMASNGRVDINWCKIQMLSYYLQLNLPDIEWIISLDSDSMLSYFSDLSFFDFLDKYLVDIDQNTIHLIVGEDHPNWHWMQINQMLSVGRYSKPLNICTIHQYVHHPFLERQFIDQEMHAHGMPVLVANLGAFFVRNSIESAQIIQEWISFANEHRSARTWLRKWPAEQAVFNCWITNNNRYRNTLFAFEFETKAINIRKTICNTSYVNHVTSSHKKARERRIPKYFQSILNQKNDNNMTTLKQSFSEYFLGPNAKFKKAEKTFMSVEFNQYSLRLSV